MSLDSLKFRTVQLSLCWSSGFLVGLVCLVAGPSVPNVQAQTFQNQNRPVIQQPRYVQPAQQPLFRQPIQQPTIVQPSQTYRNPNMQYQGGRIIQQPVPAPSYQPAPIYQGTTVPPILRATPSTPVDDNAKQALEAERAAYKAAKLEVEKLLEKNKTLMSLNEGSKEQFEALKEENVILTNRMGELSQTNERIQGTIEELRQKLESAGEEDPGAMQAAEQLKTDYRESLNQNKTLTDRVETLTTENENFRVKIVDLSAAQENMQANPNATGLTELTQLNQQLTTQNESLSEQYQALTQQNEALSQEYRTLSDLQQTTVGENKTLNDRIAKLGISNENYVSEIASLKARPAETTPAKVAPVQPAAVDTTGLESKITQLTRKNRQLSQANSGLEDENRSLNKQLAKLGKTSSVAVASNLTEPVSASVAIAEPAAAVAVPAVGGFDFSKWGALGWLIPFLVLGLGIAFFVILREEVHRPPSSSTIGGGRDSRHDRNR